MPILARDAVNSDLLWAALIYHRAGRMITEAFRARYDEPYTDDSSSPNPLPARTMLSRDHHKNGGRFTIGSSNQPATILINGVHTSSITAQSQAVSLYEITNFPVELIYNCTDALDVFRKVVAIHDPSFQGVSPASILKKGFEMLKASGTEKEMTAIRDQTLRNPPVAIAAARRIFHQLDAHSDSTVRLLGYSQGGLIAAEAIGELQCMLRSEGCSRAEISSKLSRVSVLLLGAPVSPDKFPKEIGLIQYAKDNDLIARIFGESPLNDISYRQFLKLIWESLLQPRNPTHLDYLNHSRRTDDESHRVIREWSTSPTHGVGQNRDRTHHKLATV